MDESNPLWPRRRRPVHHVPVDTDGRATIVFVTVCTWRRRPLLASDEMHLLLRDAWSAADRWLVGRYMVMPDHVHLFCAPNTFPPESLRTWVSYWKGFVAKRSALSATLWQQNFWDTQLRWHESYSLKWEYVRCNPVRAGWVVRSDDWPFQGEMKELRWHE